MFEIDPDSRFSWDKSSLMPSKQRANASASDAATTESGQFDLEAGIHAHPRSKRCARQGLATPVTSPRSQAPVPTTFQRECEYKQVSGCCRRSQKFASSLWPIDAGAPRFRPACGIQAITNAAPSTDYARTMLASSNMSLSLDGETRVAISVATTFRSASMSSFLIGIKADCTELGVARIGGKLMFGLCERFGNFPTMNELVARAHRN